MITCLTDYLEKTVNRNPEHIAVVDDDRILTFRELDERCRKLGQWILALTEGIIHRPIVVFLDKSIESVLADFAVLYSGNAFMNLDTKIPGQRLASILEQADPILAITTKKHQPLFKGIWPDERLVVVDELDFSSMDYSREILEQRHSQIVDTDPMCLINTSGSTGTPKAIVLTHRNFIDFTEWVTSEVCLHDHEVMGSLVTIAFDAHICELCLLASRGNTLVVIPGSLAAFPVKILELLQRHEVSLIFWVPTIMVNIANMDLLSRVPLPNLSTIWFIGEVFPTRQFNYWRRSFPGAQFVNFYGPAEVTVNCTYFVADWELPEGQPLPIGVPCRNVDVLILDEEDRPCGVGEEGELCVRGASLASGYYRNTAKTAEVFVQNPLNPDYIDRIYRTGDIACWGVDGNILFKGRKDSLIKHMGYRIELGELEHHAVTTLRIVKNACALYNEDKKELPVADLKKALGRVLPRYMVPAAYRWLMEMPRNHNGKIDRLQLKNSL